MGACCRPATTKDGPLSVAFTEKATASVWIAEIVVTTFAMRAVIQVTRTFPTLSQGVG